MVFTALVGLTLFKFPLLIVKPLIRFKAEVYSLVHVGRGEYNQPCTELLSAALDFGVLGARATLVTADTMSFRELGQALFEYCGDKNIPSQNYHNTAVKYISLFLIVF